MKELIVMKLKKVLALILSVTLMSTAIVSPTVAAEQETQNSDVAMRLFADGEGSNFKVSVPLYLPVYMNQTGEISVANDAKIVNESSGPVQVTGMSITGLDGWETVDYTEYKNNSSYLVVDETKVGFKINNEVTIGNDAITFAQSNWPVMAAKANDGSNELPIVYDAILPVQTAAIEKDIARVTWVIGFYNSETQPEEMIFTFDGTEYTINKNTNWGSLVDDTRYGLTVINKDGVSYVSKNGCYISAEGSTDVYIRATDIVSENTSYSTTDTTIDGTAVGGGASITIGEQTYQIEPGTTWEDLASDPSNGISIYIDTASSNKYIVVNNTIIKDESGNNVTSDSTINDGDVYYTTGGIVSGTGNFKIDNVSYLVTTGTSWSQLISANQIEYLSSFALMVNNDKTTGANAISFTEANWAVLKAKGAADNGNVLPIVYEAIVPAQSIARTTNVAVLTFTFAFDGIEYPGTDSVD